MIKNLSGLGTAHLIVDNNSTYEHPKVQAWFRRHPAFIDHSVEAANSRLTRVECWLRDLTDT